MTKLRLPGLIDAHVHLRQPGYTHKEDFLSGTTAALAGGVTVVLDMPNTTPPTATPDRLRDKARLAAANAVCDVGLFVGATNTDLDAYLPAAANACGLKIYVSDTFGSLRIDRLDLLHRFFRTWADAAAEVGYRSAQNPHGLGPVGLGPVGLGPVGLGPVGLGPVGLGPVGLGPIAVHAEELMLPVCLALAEIYVTPLHIVHVSRRSEIELIAAAKERGHAVTCEATPHHLLLSTDDLPRLGNRGDMRPRLASPDDVTALWENLPYIDIFATDHAPHTLAEKGYGAPEPPANPPPGVPGVETMLPLLLTAVHAGRLTLDDLLARCVANPRRIYGLPEQPDTWVEVEVDEPYSLEDSAMHTRVQWTPFAGMPVYGRVEQVSLRGQVVFAGGKLLAAPGSGCALFQNEASARESALPTF